jgi:cell wall-associated NlpC family hydrolase
MLPSSRLRVSPPLRLSALLFALIASGACTTTTLPRPGSPETETPAAYFTLNHVSHRQEIVLYALGLLDTGYRFGGRNPDAGLDCSGMVSYVVEKASGLKLPHNAAAIAARTRDIEREALAPGDLVFFNTARKSHSHMGIYIGDGRFIHAPSSRGVVRIEKLDSPYFASRMDGMRTLAEGK